MSSRAILVVPPLIKYSKGPLLGPALLQTAAQRNGHGCNVVDLNAKWLQLKAVGQQHHRGLFLGDHDKDSSRLNRSEALFFQAYLVPALRSVTTSDVDDLIKRIKFGFLTHAELECAGFALTKSEFGAWACRELSRELEPPNVVGFSLLHAGQLLPTVAVSNIVKELWPQVPVIWGGPHISGLSSSVLEADIDDRRFAADMFITGHAEQTFVDILDAVAGRRACVGRVSKPLVIDGRSGNTSYVPTFENLDLYEGPMVLPAQSTLGCAYGRCAFCTYPAIERSPSKLDLTTSVGSVAGMAMALDASVSIKDSLVTSTRLEAIGNCINGRAPWSACTKLSSRLDSTLLTKVERKGLKTLEVGLESLLEETQRRLSKLQCPLLFENFVRDVSQVQNLTLVVNYIVGFPWEDLREAHLKLEEAQLILDTYLGSNRSCIELNTFELERLAPMARFPEVYGIQRIKPWPWASVMEYE